jgi:hypothetical protein
MRRWRPCPHGKYHRARTKTKRLQTQGRPRKQRHHRCNRHDICGSGPPLASNPGLPHSPSATSSAEIGQGNTQSHPPNTGYSKLHAIAVCPKRAHQQRSSASANRSRHSVRFVPAGEFVMPIGPLKKFNNITGLGKVGAPSRRPPSDYFAGVFGHDTGHAVPRKGIRSVVMRLRQAKQWLTSILYR